MNPLWACCVALLLTLAATGIGWLLQGAMQAENLALIYMAAVIVTAVYTSTLPALLSAFSGFLAFNFFFTEPRGTFLIHEREDALTAAFFLLIALLVGPLAARLQSKIRILEFRDASARIELHLLERMSAAIHPDDIMDALQSALSELVRVVCTVVRVGEANQLRWEEAAQPDGLTRSAILAAIAQTDRFQPAAVLLRNPVLLVKTLADGDRLLAVVLIPLTVTGQNERSVESCLPSVDILLRQAGLALARTRLLTDLAQERMEKEQELLRSSLLSSVSHDFRTPLTAMIGATSTLMEMADSLTQEQQRELLESVLSEAQRLNNYTQNLLDMTRLGRGELRLERSWVSIDEIINVTLKRIRPLAEAHHLVVRMAAGLPLLRVHPALIEQAIFNVLHNALKFSPAGTTVSLSGHATEVDGRTLLVLEISDEGPGIVESEREKVFRMFHTAEQGDRRVAGSGLGLAICRGMIGAHGGSVSVLEGASGRGCLVRMSIPVAVPEENGTGGKQR
ncbi:MAG: DUF4118 domain-containing protein [Pseudomonadota bacterium]